MASAASSDRSPVTPEQRDAVDEAAAPGADRRAAARRTWSAPRAARSRPRRRRRRRPSRRARRAGGRARSRRRRPTRRAAARTARGPCGGPGCNRSSPRSGRRRRGRRARRRSPAGVAPMSSARCDASWIVRPSITGSENGMPDLDRVGAGGGDGPDDVEPAAAEPAGHVRDEQLVAGVARRARSVRSRGSRERLAGEHLGHLVRVLVAPARQRDQHRRALRDPLARPPGRASRSRGRARAPGRSPRWRRGAGTPRAPRRRWPTGTRPGPARRARRAPGPTPGIVEAGADRVGLEDLAVLVLQEERAGAVQHAGRPAATPTRRAARSRARARRPRRRSARASVSTKPAKVPIAFEPPPTHATTKSGSAPPRISRHCSRASSPTMRWNSRTIHGNGCGPTTEPMQ